MNLNQLTTPAGLERNSFLWSEARLGVAAVALFLGGIPPAAYFLGNSSTVWGLLRIAWIVSGLASAYLGYRWLNGGQRVFGGKDQRDTAAFLVSVISGLNLGWTGIAGNNVGMSIASGRMIFAVVGALYLVAAYHLYRRWQAYGERVF
jgi:hypothetical protein